MEEKLYKIMKSMVRVKLEEESQRVLLNILSKGVPEKFVRLFEFGKKSEAQSFAKTLTITHEELSHLVFNCSDIGFVHSRKHIEFLPDHLKITDEDWKSLGPVGETSDGNAKKFFNKVTTIFKQRKNINGHLFECSANQWHLFYFTYRDILDGGIHGRNHWEGGAHIHYVSHLWGSQKDILWARLSEKDYSIPGVHIKFEMKRSDREETPV